MYAYIEAFNSYLEQSKCNCGYPNVSTVLELLYSRYQQNKGMDAAQVKAYYDELYKTAVNLVLDRRGRRSLQCDSISPIICRGRCPDH